MRVDQPLETADVPCRWDSQGPSCAGETVAQGRWENLKLTVPGKSSELGVQGLPSSSGTCCYLERRYLLSSFQDSPAMGQVQVQVQVQGPAVQSPPPPFRPHWGWGGVSVCVGGDAGDQPGAPLLLGKDALGEV